MRHNDAIAAEIPREHSKLHLPAQQNAWNGVGLQAAQEVVATWMTASAAVAAAAHAAHAYQLRPRRSLGLMLDVQPP